ncbi:MAG: hypothetical protein GY780_07210 [bacterium]|nr:hypothetical protein [bacterium]
MRISLRIMILLVLMAAASTAVAQPEQINVPVPAGWTAVDQEYRYDRENLWEYINGAAELFLTYGFRELIVLDVEKGDSGLTISVYDMGTSLGAFGIFEREKPATGDQLKGIGGAAILQPPYRALLLKDRFYVKMEVGGDDVSAELLTQAMADVAANLPGSDELPPQLALLPEADRLPGTVAFAGRDFLGISDLRNCMHASYELADGVEYQLFVMKPSQAFLGNKRGKWTVENRQGDELLIWREIPYTGVVVLLGDEKQMLGVAGFEDFEAAVNILESLQK